MFETIKTIIIVILAAGFTSAVAAGVALCRNIAQAKKDYQDAEVDGTFTDAEYAVIGKDVVGAVQNCKTIWGFIKTAIASVKAVTVRVKAARIAAINKLLAQK